MKTISRWKTKILLIIFVIFIVSSFFQSAIQEVSKCNDCTLEEQAIINIIKANSSIKQEEIAKVINKSLRTVKTRMIEMQEKGLIVRKNGKRNGEWVIL